MSPLFWADEESVLLCFPAAVGNTLSFVSCVFSALLPGRAGGSGKSHSPLRCPKCNASVGAEQSSPAGRVNRTQQVTAVARNMRKAGHGRRSQSLADGYYSLCSDLGHI